MIIAIDYDGTITEDFKMFSDIIRLIKRSGHNPIIVTMRHKSEEDLNLSNLRTRIGGGVNVYYTGRKAKRDFMFSIGILVDIWIDDRPDWILEDSK